jgi:hypothetical protein
VLTNTERQDRMMSVRGSISSLVSQSSYVGVDDRLTHPHHPHVRKLSNQPKQNKIATPQETIPGSSHVDAQEPKR